MEVVSLWMYTIMVLSNMETLVYGANHNEHLTKCEPYDLGHAQQWMMLEICAFFTNLLVLSINLLVSIIPSKCLRDIIFKRRHTFSSDIISMIVNRQLKFDNDHYDSYKIIDEREAGGMKF